VRELEQKPQKEARPKLYHYLLLAAAIFLLGFWFGQSSQTVPSKTIFPKIQVLNQEPAKPKSVDFSLFWDVWNGIEASYLNQKTLDPQKLLYGAISGLVNSLEDPYSAFLTPEQNEAVKQELSGFYEGVGIQLGAKDGKIVVIAPLSDTPAVQAGIRAGDVILKIDDKETIGMSLPEAVALIRGSSGSKVKLSIARGEEEIFEKELVRAKIDLKTVELTFRGDVAILRLLRFSEKTQSEWDRAVQEIEDKKADGLILDLRNNPGGFLQGAVYVAAEFVQGKIVGQEDKSGKKDFLPAQRRGKLLDLPLVVIINQGSASASEIVAGAIQEKKRAKLVGEQSFGKGTVQDAQDLAGGSGLHITVAKWLLPSGRDINGQGLRPDVEVKQDVGQDKEGQDLQQEMALEVLKSMVK
jgi:carboxyl-terminal processing protease